MNDNNYHRKRLHLGEYVFEIDNSSTMFVHYLNKVPRNVCMTYWRYYQF